MLKRPRCSRGISIVPRSSFRTSQARRPTRSCEVSHDAHCSGLHPGGSLGVPPVALPESRTHPRQADRDDLRQHEGQLLHPSHALSTSISVWLLIIDTTIVLLL